MQDFDPSKSGIIARGLKSHLRQELEFPEIFATWLSLNLHRLKESSVKLLYDLDPESYPYVRLSTVTEFDYESLLIRFKGRAKCIYSGLQSDKLIIIETAMTLTSDKGIMINIE